MQKNLQEAITQVVGEYGGSNKEKTDFAKDVIREIDKKYCLLDKEQQKENRELFKFRVFVSDSEFKTQKKSMDNWLIEKQLKTDTRYVSKAEPFFWFGALTTLVGVLGSSFLIAASGAGVSLYCSGSAVYYAIKADKKMEKYFNEHK